MFLEPFTSKFTSNYQDNNHFPTYDLSDTNSFDLLGMKACKGMGACVREIAFIDPTVPNYQTLLEGIHPYIQFVVLDANKDGVKQITDALTDGKYSAVHIISHGSSGSIQIGSSHLAYDNITEYAGELQQWKDALTPDADILLYGCNVANLTPHPPLLAGEGAQDTPPLKKGGQGGILLQQLSQLTGADIAASDDLTGSAALGGDWILENTAGQIETPVAFQAQTQAAYSSTLDATYYPLSSGAFTQNWSNTRLILTEDNWSSVPSIIGYLGDDSTAAVTGIDPQTVLDPRTTTIDVNANRTNADTFFTGGVAEFHTANPTVALQGSGTADAPFILVHLDTRGMRNIQVAYNLRDIDGSANNANQSVALQYRVGTSGNFINVPAGYVADASTGPSLATLVTPVSVTLPAAVDNQAQVQVRIITTNAFDSDEWIGIDDINISGTPLNATEFVVTNTNNSGAGSLRQAILDANADPGTDTIRFNMPGSGVKTITPSSALPTITDAVIIDGTTQPGFSGTPIIELNGSSAGSGVSGLSITAGNSTVKGLVINRFSRHGIELTSNGNNVIQGNYIGTDVNGILRRSNSSHGIFIFHSPNNLIGGTTFDARNLISGNVAYGVVIEGSSAVGNIVQGNYIGTNVNGTAALGNVRGIQINNAPNNIIGGTAFGARNVISGNSNYGVGIQGSTAAANSIQGNYIGTNVNGTAALGNTLHGVYISDAPSNSIGGTVAEARNIISGNDQVGVWISGITAVGNIVQGNYIGTDVNGTIDLGNGFYGVNIVDAPNNTIGGTASGSRNVISGNNQHGVEIYGSSAVGNLVQGNYIGTAANGTSSLRNSSHGVFIRSSASNNTIGGTVAGAGNTLAFNGGDGVYANVDAGSGNRILSNAIFSNTGLGIDLAIDGVTSNDNGDGDTGANNLQNSPILTAATSSGGSTTITGTLNSIANTTFRIEFFSNTALDASGFGEGETFLGSSNVTTDASGNATINVTLPTAIAAGQFITATATDANNNTSEFSQGIAIAAQTSANVVTNTNDSGAGSLRAAIAFANSNPGTDTIVFSIPGSGIKTIALLSALPTITEAIVIDGTTQPGFSGTPIIELNGSSAGIANGLRINAGNSTVKGLIINRFTGSGISLETNGNNVIQGNYIGTDASGTLDLGNSLMGININNAPNNTIGGTTAGTRNLISGNNRSGISISGSNALGNLVLGNYIGTDVSGTASLGNSFHGVSIDGPNNTIGGTVPQARNIISGNQQFGISISGNGAGGNLVQGNYIGTDVNGTADLGNTWDGVLINANGNTIGGTTTGTRNVISGNDRVGIFILDGTRNLVQGNYIGTAANGISSLGNSSAGVFALNSSNNTIGGTTAGAGNILAFNRDDGVYVISGTGNRILSNAIFSNSGLGIDLGADGVTPNDPGDGDTGANNLQNFPVLTSALRNGGNVAIAGTLNSTPNQTFRIEFFNTNDLDPTGYGEGQTYLGATDVTTDGNGNATFDVTLAVTGIEYITATATDPNNNTSEFSQGRLVVTDFQPPTAILNPISAITTLGGSTQTFTVTYSDNVAINVASLDSADIRISGPNGFNQLATLVSVNPSGNGTPRTATYQITAPGGTWNVQDNGTYNVFIESNQVRDTSNNSIPPWHLGTFTVNIPDTTSPTASLNPIPSITFDTSSAQIFTVTYTDDVAINDGSLDSRDILVTGPNGFSQLAQLFGVNSFGNNTPRTATYGIFAPDGTWGNEDNGTYTLTMQANQVRDTSNNSVAAGSLGAFVVNIPDRRPPSVTSVIVPANGTYRAGQTLEFTVNFSEAVTVDTNSPPPALLIFLDQSGNQAPAQPTYVSGSGSNALVFRYTVVPGSLDSNGISVSSFLGGNIRDAAGNNAVPILNNIGATEGVLVDAVAPTVANFTPSDDAGNVGVGANLAIAFNESVTANAGNIIIKRSDGSTFETIAVTDSTKVTISGNSVTINPTNDFAFATGYYIEIDSTAIKDTAGNNFAGISGNSTWNFTTAAPPNAAPILDLNGAASGINYNTTFTRAGGAVAIGDRNNLTLTDDGNTINSATVRITNLQNGSSEVLNAVTTNTNISASYNNGILSLTGSDTVANYQTVLRSITYNNTAVIPNTTSRNIEFVVSDGSLNSTVATTTLAINMPTTSLGSNITAGTRSRPPVASLNNTNSEVLYSFNLSSATRVVANLMMNGGNADLALLDSNGVVLASSIRGGTLAENFDRSGLSAGNYFIRVYRVDPGATVNYQLSINFA